MPKSYSDSEKEYIVKRLREEAAKCMARYGIRRTTVDELVKRVKIPKGTFYLFYSSKELLLFEVILEQHERIEQEMYQATASLDPSTLTPDQLSGLLLQFYKMASEEPVLNMLDKDEVELLARKLPPEVVGEHLSHDEDMLGKMLQILQVKKEVDVKAFRAAFRALYFSTLHREEIGEIYYEEALHLLIRGLVTQMM